MTEDPRDPAPLEADITEDDTEFGNDHPLSSPSELAGTADRAIAAEFAARDAEEGIEPDNRGGIGPAAGDQLASS
jgi:hypothetical protein